MFEHRNLRSDLFALGLSAVAVLMVVSLCTYSPADNVGEMLWPISLIYQPDQVVFPQHEQLQNLCGRTGAVLADILLNTLGIGAYYLALSMTVLSVLLLMRREINGPALRTTGWLMSMTGLVTLFTILLPSASPGPVIGSGGYLGALASDLLTSHFATAGAVILSLSLVVGGLLLCTDYVLLQIAGAAAKPAVAVLGRGVKVRFAKTASSEKKSRRIDGAVVDPDKLKSKLKAANAKLKGEELVDEQLDEEYDEEYEVDDYDEEEDVDAGPKVTFLGRKQKSADDAAEGDDEAYEEDELEEEYDDNEEEIDAHEATAAVVPKPKFLAGPKIKNNGKKPTAKEKQQAERQAVMQSLDAAATGIEEVEDYELPSLELLHEGDDVCFEQQEMEVLEKARQLEKTFESFGFNVKVVEIETGPVIAQYEIELEAGLRLAKITNLADDIAIALRVPSVRIVAPIPGKNTVGIEVPNTNRQMVRLRDVMQESGARVKKMGIPVYLGKDVSGHPMVEDLARMPHLLIAGRTGTGKSVCLNAIISSMLMTRRPDEVRMLMIDPKMVELSGYGSLPHLMHPVVTDMRKAEAILAWAVDKMEERYSLLAKAGVRQISSYNQLSEEELYDRLDAETDEDKEAVPLHLPYIVIVADEIADMMMVCGKDVESHIIRLAQKSRAVGIHLILATQKPTVDVITGLIKSNLPARLSFQVASRTDSRVVLDEMGAEKLLGDGDMLFLKPGTSQLLRGQGTYLGDDEIDTIVGAVSTGEQNFVEELVSLKPKDEEGNDPAAGGLKNRDDLYESAIDVVVREQRGSCSLLQRSLGIGYGRAARLIDFMAEDGIVGAYAGSQARDVLLTIEDWERMQGGGGEPESDAQAAAEEVLAEAAAEAPTIQPEVAKVKSVTKKRRSNRIIPVPDVEDDEEEELLEDELEDDESEGDEYDDADDEWDEDAEYDEEEYDDEEEYAETA